MQLLLVLLASAAITSSSILLSKPVSRTGALPSPSDFASQKGTNWTISTVGYISSSSMPALSWDKGRTSSLSGTTFWNFGDVTDRYAILKNGFSMGAAFYATPGNMLSVDTKDILNVNNYNFAKPDPSDEEPPIGHLFGMDTSNVAEVSPGVGIGFVREIWRNATGGEEVDRGSGIIRVTLGDLVPIATRTGPLITGVEGIQIGMTSVLAAEGYVYAYTNYGPNGLIVGRAPLANAFSASAYEFRLTSGQWVPGIPITSNMNKYGIGGNVHSDGQGSVFFNSYLKKYMFFVGAYGSYMNFHTSDTPYGPWSGEYGVAENMGYGINVHPQFSPDGDHSVLYVSSGAADGITMRKIEFKY